MFPWPCLNYLFPPLSNMLIFGASLIFTTAAGITAFLLITSGSVKTFKKNLFSKNRSIQLPIVTLDGNVVDTKEELDTHLEVLENKLLEKVGEIATSKTKINDAKESIDKLNSTQVQVKRYYIKLREEIAKSEDDCKRLQSQIDEFREKRYELEKEMQKNETYYKHILGIEKNTGSCDSSRVSSRSSLSKGDSSSFFDSSPCGNEEQSADTEEGDLKPKCRTKTRTKTSTVTKPEFTDLESKCSTLTNNTTLEINPVLSSNLPLEPNRSSKSLKKNSSLSSFLISSATGGSAIASKVYSKSQNMVGFKKLSDAAPQRPKSVKEQLEITGKMIGLRPNFQKQNKFEDYPVKRNSNTKTSSKSHQEKN